MDRTGWTRDDYEAALLKMEREHREHAVDDAEYVAAWNALTAERDRGINRGSLGLVGVAYGSCALLVVAGLVLFLFVLSFF